MSLRVISSAGLRLALSAPADAHGWRSRWTTVDGTRIHDRHRMPAPDALPVVLVHGLAVSHRYLMPTAHALSGRHPVHVPDLPGFGLSDKPRRALDVRGHTDVLAAWLGARGLDRVCVVGHSYGAEIAARLAHHRPDLVAALVLGGPTADPVARSRRGLIGRWSADLLVEDPRQARILARDVRDAKPWRVFATLGHSVRNPVEEDLREVTAPTLVLGGGWDPVAPARWRRQVATLCGGASVTVPGAGHNVLTTAGRRSADAIADHLAKIPSAPHGNG
jgi:pimeloyl-ACP methyl ester carboxylesterase